MDYSLGAEISQSFERTEASLNSLNENIEQSGIVKNIQYILMKQKWNIKIIFIPLQIIF